MNKLNELAKLGQSVWLDYISRKLIVSGELKTRIANGLRGMTSNPTIFEKAIAGSSDYDSDLKELNKLNYSIEEIYEHIVMKDISLAADEMKPVYDSSNGLMGM